MWSHSVTAFTARVSDLQRLVTQHPEAAPAVRQIATQQETDMAVAEAMRRLKIFSAMAPPRGPGSGESGGSGSGGAGGCGGGGGGGGGDASSAARLAAPAAAAAAAAAFGP
ncbi:MAG: hypothetical protein J3K34DRAFT_465249 [Monoraphidium minutum]|nr:MAG: hypothetical protein J3K34DRAFT_465249 [Monoraphidium minutum]